MSKRTSEGLPALEFVFRGDPTLSETLGDALAAMGPVERYTHGFHTYPAGLHPDAARTLLGLMPEGPVLDPFMGGGTVMVEAVAAGRKAYGRDVSPTALRVARLRSAFLSEDELTPIRSRARLLTQVAPKDTPYIDPVEYQVLEPWYNRPALTELASIRAGIRASESHLQPYLEGLLSSIIIKTSWRKSDTSAQKEKHRRPEGTTAVLFHKRAREWGRAVAELREAVPEGTPRADLGLQDARILKLPEKVAGVVTSPPYPATYDYVKLQHLRNVWFGDDSKVAQRRELGARRDWREGEKDAAKRWRNDTKAWQRAMANNLQSGGRLCIVIGDGLTPGGTIDSRGATEEAARDAGLTSVASASLARPDHARGEVRWEHVFLFEKP